MIYVAGEYLLEKISGDNVYQFLLFFDKLYYRFTDMEKTFMKSFLEEVNIYEAEQEDGITYEFDAGIWSSLVQEVIVKAKDYFCFQ